MLLAFSIATLAAPLSAIGAEPIPSDASNRRCMQCHGQPHIGELGPAERRSMVGSNLQPGQPLVLSTLPSDSAASLSSGPAKRPGLFVRPDALSASPHAELQCIQCHEDAAALPHAPSLQRATCATACHSVEFNAYQASAHRAALDAANPLAPTCASCHGSHDILPVSDRRSSQHKLNSLHLCGDCHAQHSPTANDADPSSRITDYLDSAHARAVTKSGLPTAATCSDCHTAHDALPAKDPRSSVNRKNIPETCGRCHVGVAEIYEQSVHGRKHRENNGEAAVCTDCHTAHQITNASTPAFLRDVINECGRCHDSPDANGDRVGSYYRTYAESYHGQVTHLGATRAARCSDCHGAHDIRPLDDPTSRVAPANLVQTCASCHPGASANFVKFDPHANFRDAERYPFLHGVWLYFMIMMSTVFTFFGIHTILWFMRSLVDRARHGRPVHPPAAPTAIRRFTGFDRINHLLVAVTFFGLTATGIPLVFAQDNWAKVLAALFGGIEAAGIWHRFFAILLISNLILHFISLGRKFLNRTNTWQQWLFGPASLLPRWKDAKDCFGMFRWFVGLGRKPRFDRWTYWEKFDYWAEVGGSMIIGGSGLLLWFPEIAARILPGWLFNVAMIVHGYEALLAIGFIFTIHFFNTHVRPDAFPVDEVIFTGSLSEHELKEQRPEEYERLVRAGQLESLRVPAPSPARRPLIVTVAAISVGVGVSLLILIIIGGLF
jgi:cytochrome b subunit of formate dehydrogenase